MSLHEQHGAGRPWTERVAERQVQLFVVSRPTVDGSAVARFLAAHSLEWRRTPDATPAEQLVELAGRLCYLSFGAQQSPKTNSEYVRHLIAQGHESVLEHATWSFVLTGVTRAFSHQLVRHRVGFAYSQLSQQYHDETDADVIPPEAVRRLPEAEARWHSAVASSRDAYRQLLELLEEMPTTLPPREHKRLVRTAARSVLSNATETKLLFTANARALRHFLKTRGTIEGDEEMRLVTALLLDTMNEEAPAIFPDFRVELLADGLPVVRYVPLGS